MAGYSVLFTPTTTLVVQLPKAHADGRLEERLTHYAKPALLIIDKLGHLPFEPNAAHLFFQLVSRRYERGAMLATSNRPVGEWGTVFGDPVVATAILDRLLHHSHVLTIRGDSYRLREKRRSGPLQKSATARQTVMVHPDQPEPGVVLAAVKHAARRRADGLRPCLTAAARDTAAEPGRGRGTVRFAEQRNIRWGSIPGVAKGAIPDVAGHRVSRAHSCATWDAGLARHPRKGNVSASAGSPLLNRIRPTNCHARRNWQCVKRASITHQYVSFDRSIYLLGTLVGVVACGSRWEQEREHATY